MTRPTTNVPLPLDVKKLKPSGSEGAGGFDPLISDRTPPAALVSTVSASSVNDCISCHTQMTFYCRYCIVP